jgi:hypothetical protein
MVYSFQLTGGGAAKIVNFSFASSINRYSGFLPDNFKLSEMMIGTPSPRLSMMKFRWLPTASTCIGQRASKELINPFREDCCSEMLSIVMVLGMVPGENSSSLAENKCKRP